MFIGSHVREEFLNFCEDSLLQEDGIIDLAKKFNDCNITSAMLLRYFKYMACISKKLPL
jgi:hypothetical protein